MSQLKPELGMLLEAFHKAIGAENVIVIAVNQSKDDAGALESMVMTSIADDELVTDILVQVAMKSQSSSNSNTIGILSIEDGDFSFENFYDALPPEAQEEIDKLPTDKRESVRTLLNAFSGLVPEPETPTQH